MEPYSIVTGADIDWRAYRDLRLFGLSTDPDAFAGSLATEGDFPDSYWIDRTRSMADGLERKGFFVRGENGEYVAACTSARDIDMPKCAHVVSITTAFVRPEARGRGIAKELFGRMLDAWLADPTVRKFQLEVVATNPPAIRLYESFGFLAIGQRREELLASDGGYLDTVVMERSRDAK